MKSPFDVENLYQTPPREAQVSAVKTLLDGMKLGEEAFLFLDGKLTKVKKIVLNQQFRLKIIK